MTRSAQQPVLTPTLYSHPSNLTPKNISEQLTPYFPQSVMPLRGTIRDERGYTGAESGQVENDH
jgi:hypothetical protein